MGTRCTLFQKTTLEIDQDRYEELVRKEMKYEQYKNASSEKIREIIEAKKPNLTLGGKENGK